MKVTDQRKVTKWSPKVLVWLDKWEEMRTHRKSVKLTMSSHSNSSRRQLWRKSREASGSAEPLMVGFQTSTWWRVCVHCWSARSAVQSSPCQLGIHTHSNDICFQLKTKKTNNILSSKIDASILCTTNNMLNLFPNVDIQSDLSAFEEHLFFSQQSQVPLWIS